MAKYKVIRKFRDLQDNDHIYNFGDEFPRKGATTEERVVELSTAENKIGIPLIALVEEKPTVPPSEVDLNNTVESLTEDITGDLGDEKLNELLLNEQAGKNRKGVIEHIASLLKEVGEGSEGNE